MELLKPEDIDFSQYLRATDAQQKVREAKVYLDEIRQDIINPPKNIKCSMPWPKTEMNFNFRPGEVTVYAGSNGGGKSLITGMIALNLVKQDRKVCLMSFEMKPKTTLQRMVRQFSGEDIYNIMIAGKADYQNKFIDRFEKFTDKKMWLYDQQGTVNTAQVISVSRYCAMELGIEHIFVDSLMKCVRDEDSYNDQKNFVDELTSLARDTNAHIHLVHHIRKLSNEEDMPNKHDIKGSGSIADQVDNVFLMWRNKKKEHAIQQGEEVDPLKPDAILMCEKQRNGESEDWHHLWYHRESQQFIEGPDSVPMAFDVAGSF